LKRGGKGKRTKTRTFQWQGRKKEKKKPANAMDQSNKKSTRNGKENGTQRKRKKMVGHYISKRKKQSKNIQSLCKPAGRQGTRNHGGGGTYALKMQKKKRFNHSGERV